jgi:hypothetical protein
LELSCIEKKLFLGFRISPAEDSLSGVWPPLPVPEVCRLPLGSPGLLGESKDSFQEYRAPCRFRRESDSLSGVPACSGGSRLPLGSTGPPAAGSRGVRLGTPLAESWLDSLVGSPGLHCLWGVRLGPVLLPRWRDSLLILFFLHRYPSAPQFQPL